MSFRSNQVEDASLLTGHDAIQEDRALAIGHVTHAELQRLELVPSKGRAPKDDVWDFAHHIAAKLLQGTALEAIDVKAAATRFFPGIAKSGGNRDRATKYAKIIAEYFRALGAVADTSLSMGSTGLLGALASPPFLVGADKSGLPLEEKSAIRAALEEAVASGSAASIEEKLARLGLDEAQPAPSNSPHVSAGSSSADAAASAPLSPTQPEDEPVCSICLDGAELPSHPLVQPCACRGSSTWAHAECLAEWWRTSATSGSCIKTSV